MSIASKPVENKILECMVKYNKTWNVVKYESILRFGNETL